MQRTGLNWPPFPRERTHVPTSLSGSPTAFISCYGSSALLKVPTSHIRHFIIPVVLEPSG